MDYVLVSAEVAVTESFYNQYLESGNNVEVIVDENAEHGFVRDTLQILVFAPLFCTLCFSRLVTRAAPVISSTPRTTSATVTTTEPSASSPRLLLPVTQFIYNFNFMSFPNIPNSRPWAQFNKRKMGTLLMDTH